jgi:N-acetylglutamate synthase-like GNAT family acetyltransferase
MSYRVYQADLVADKQDIIDFWRANYPTWPLEKYAMFYENHPDGQAACFTARDTENVMVGTVALFPRRISINGRLVSAAVVGDLAIRVDNRGTGLVQSLRSAMLDYVRQSGLDFVYGTANTISKKVLEKDGFRAIGETVWMVKIIRSERYVKKWVKPAPLARLISYPIDWALRWRYRKILAQLEDLYAWEDLTRFDERFDVLWQEAQPTYTITGERNARFLNWRFADCPYKQIRVFALVRKSDKKLIGYVVYRPSPGGTHIEDFFAVEPDRMFRLLLSEFLCFVRRQGFDAVTFYYFGEDRLIAMFEQFGFARRDVTRTMVIHVNDESPIRADVLNPRRWHFLFADNDVDA